MLNIPSTYVVPSTSSTFYCIQVVARKADACQSSLIFKFTSIFIYSDPCKWIISNEISKGSKKHFRNKTIFVVSCYVLYSDISIVLCSTTCWKDTFYAYVSSGVQVSMYLLECVLILSMHCDHEIETRFHLGVF